MFISLLAQRNEPKKGLPYHIGLSLADFPQFSKIDGRCGTRFAQTVLALFPSIFSKFGKVMMGKKQ
jgi:hypothetical protein